MKELNTHQVEQVNGGNPLAIMFLAGLAGGYIYEKLQ